ncbi:MAG: hypothetical protein CMJ62_17175 [Planctomycetaceae bacterium]|nr:hypothetical protein [Planctomycetaceae bacterium]
MTPVFDFQPGNAPHLSRINVTTTPERRSVRVSRHSDDGRAVIATNYRVVFCTWPTVEFNTVAQSILEADQRTGQEASLLHGNPTMDRFQIECNLA